MNFRLASLTAAVVCLCGSALAQAPTDYRVDADFRVPNLGQWAANESVGGASFRVHSRYLAVYYGGVLRQDNFSFTVQIDFRDISGFDEHFAASPYNTDFDIYINDDFVGRAPMSATDVGLAELTYKSRHPDFPELPVPANWPSPINPGSLVRVFGAATALPEIGDPFPAGAPLLVLSSLEERYARGDADHDGHVDEVDFAILTLNYDPANLVGPHVGPMAGDFTGDNRSDLADFEVMVLNWDDRDPPQSPPDACMGAPSQPASVNTCRGGTASFAVTPSGTGPFSYQWMRDGVAGSLASNPSSTSAALVLSDIRAGDAGEYVCVVSNQCGSVTTGGASLAVCDADFNCDSFVDFFDYNAFVEAFESGGTAADFNGDAFVDFFDYDDFVGAFETGC